MDYNFYQSQLRQHINRDIYRKPVGMITIAGQQCQYVIKRKSVVGVTLNRYQILGLELPVAYLTDPILFHQKVMSVCHQQFAGQGDCFVQLGLSNQLGITDTRKTKLDGYHDQRDARRRQQGSGIMRLGGYEGVVENMPAATIMLDLSISGDELFAQFGRSTRTHIRKAQKHGLTVETATRADWDSYYEIRSSTGDSKGFAVQSRVCYDALRNYLLTTNQGQLYVVRDGDTIIAGAICVQVDDVYVYLYGGTRRGIGNLGHAQLLHWEIIQSAQTQGFAYYDLLGCAPGSLQPHHLDGVTQFKAGFGGVKIEYLGSYDFPLSQWKYNMFRRYRKTKG